MVGHILGINKNPDLKFPLRVEGNHFADQYGRPFLLWGDAAYSIIAQLNITDVRQYLDDRVTRKINTILVSLLEHKFATNAPNNIANVAPFTTAGNFSTPNETYFAYADSIIAECASRGILVLLNPCYLGYQIGDEGWGTEVQANSSGNCTGYGQYIGNRYKTFDNIIWVHGGDVNANNYTGLMAKVDAIANGIKDNDTIKPKLHTAHSVRHDSAIADYNRSWLTANTTYSDKTGVLAESQNDYTSYLSNAKPFFFLEGNYENESSAPTVANLRSQALLSLFSGSTGHVFGNCPMWHFSSDIWGFCSSGLVWQTELSSNGIQAMTMLKTFLDTVAWHKCTPDTSHVYLTAGYSTSGTNDVATMRSNDNTLLLAYLSTQRQITIDLSKFAGTSLAVSWVKPSDLSVTSEGSFSPSGTHNYTPPASGDWILKIIAT